MKQFIRVCPEQTCSVKQSDREYLYFCFTGQSDRDSPCSGFTG